MFCLWTKWMDQHEERLQHRGTGGWWRNVPHAPSPQTTTFVTILSASFIPARTGQWVIGIPSSGPRKSDNKIVNTLRNLEDGKSTYRSSSTERSTFARSSAQRHRIHGLWLHWNMKKGYTGELMGVRRKGEICGEQSKSSTARLCSLQNIAHGRKGNYARDTFTARQIISNKHLGLAWRRTWRTLDSRGHFKILILIFLDIQWISVWIVVETLRRMTQ